MAIVAASTLLHSLQAAEPVSVASFDERAQKGEPLTVAFFGGSLTYGANATNPNTTSYRGLMAQYLLKKYPKTQFTFIDAAIGGTGSDLGLFRLERDVLAFKPDLVFLEFTMNDGPDEVDPQKLATYEHLLRTLLQKGIAVQPVITTFKFFVDNPKAPVLPLLDDHLKLAKTYGVPAANIHQSIRDGVTAKTADLEVLWAIDPVHPDDAGYEWFFNVARDQFEKNIADKVAVQIPKKALFEELFPNVERQILADTKLPAGWKREKTRRTSLWFDGLSSRWMTDVAAAKGTTKDGETVKPVKVEPLEIKFKGSLVGLFGERDSISAPFRVWIDGKPISKPKATPEDENIWKIDTGAFSPPKAGSGNLFSWLVLSRNLKDGEHTLKIEPLFDKTDPEAELRIESVCSAGR